MGAQDAAQWFWQDPNFHSTAKLVGGIGLVWTLMELLSYWLATPYFMKLLQGNPKLAGQTEKQRRTAVQMCPRLVCFVHNALQIPLAFMILLDPAFFKDTIFAGNDFSTLVMAISAGYFLYDTLECIYRLEHEGWDFLFHGVFCFLVFTNLTYTGVMHFFGAGFLLWELSTPFMHMRWVLYKMGKESTAVYKYNALTGMLIFFLCRIVWGNALSLIFWYTSYQALLTPRGAELPMSVVWFYRVCTILMNGLNAWWFSKMVKMLLSAAKDKGAEMKTQ